MKHRHARRARVIFLLKVMKIGAFKRLSLYSDNLVNKQYFVLFVQIFNGNKWWRFVSSNWIYSFAKNRSAKLLFLTKNSNFRLKLNTQNLSDRFLQACSCKKRVRDISQNRSFFKSEHISRSALKHCKKKKINKNNTMSQTFLFQAWGTRILGPFSYRTAAVKY